MPVDRRLADRLGQRRIEPLGAPRQPAIRAHGYLARRRGPRVVAHVEHHRPVRQLHRLALVDAAAGRDPAQPPARAAVVAVHDVRAHPRIARRAPVIARRHQPPRVRAPRQLDPRARPRGIPGPLRRLHVGGNLPRLVPGQPVVARGRHIRPAGVLAGPRLDRPLRIVVAVPGHEQPDCSRFTIHDGTWVAAGVAVAPYGRGGAPRAAAVGRALEQHVDAAGVAHAVGAPLAEGQHRAGAGDRQRRDAVGVVAVPAGRPDVFLF